MTDTAAAKKSRGSLRILTSAWMLSPVGGIETSTLQDGAALSGRGHDLVVFYGEDGPDRARYEDSGATVRGPFPFGFSPATFVRDAISFLPAARLARRFRPDLLWLNRSDQIIWAQVVARIAGIPIVCHLHHAPNYRRLRLVYTGVAHFIAVSDHARDLWIERGIEASRITVVHNAIRDADYPPGGAPESDEARARLGLPPDIPVVLQYGRLTEEKGLLVMIEAWRLLGLPADAARLVLVGDPAPELSPDVLRALGTLPAGCWHWFPTVSDIVPYLHAADLTVLPSLEHESFGRVLIETMSTGRPAIGSRVGGVPEVLGGPFARFLVEAGDPAALAERMREVIDWRAAEPGLGAECREWVSERFHYDRHIESIERILQTRRRGPALRLPKRRRRTGPVGSAGQAESDVTAYSGTRSPSRSADDRP